MTTPTRKYTWCLALLAALAAPSSAFAHIHAGEAGGFLSGVHHPISGWDHVLCMVAVGILAARLRGRAVWQLPLTFVGVMSLGGLAGALGLAVPGVELMILLSVVVLALLAVRRTRFQTGVYVLIVGCFAFFHGTAHGLEMPASASLLSYALGFVVATCLLHGVGIMTARASVAVLAFAAAGRLAAQDTGGTSPATSGTDLPAEPPIGLPLFLVKGRADSLIGVADSAGQGTVGAAQLDARPLLRVGEILETVPGVIITQHAGGGKANQYFLRGFNLDHGTDFGVTLDGMPLNLPTHAHGQGYADMNGVIPELVERINFEKGVYSAANGDFTSAGAAQLEFFQSLPQDLADLEFGMYGFARGVWAGSRPAGRGQLLGGVELYHDDGPWVKPDNYKKINGLATYSQGDLGRGFSATLRASHGTWDSSDQVAASAVDSGLVPFFGSLDSTTGGNSQRYSLQGAWHHRDDHAVTKVSAYAFYYDLDLFSNFTYYLTDPTRGDQFEQQDRRWVAGLTALHTEFSDWGGRSVTNTVGLQFRNDWINNGLYNTQDRQRVEKIDSSDGSVIPATTRHDEVDESSLGLYYENTIRWAEKFRTVSGLREDFYRFDVTSNLAANTGRRQANIASPKLTLVFGPWSGTELYVQGGLGFHSNDGRGTTTHVDPVSGDPVVPADPLVPTSGAEVGVRTVTAAGLQSTLSVWLLDSASELVFAGDAGTTEPSRPSRRYGVEWGNYYQLTKTLTLDADFSFSHAEFTDSDPAGNNIPGSVESVVAAGITYRTQPGFSASLRLRYFGPRPLIEDNSFRSRQTVLVNTQVGYKFGRTWTLSLDVLNLLNRRDHDIDYAYESRVLPTGPAATQIHFHPVEPRQVRATLSAEF